MNEVQVQGVSREEAEAAFARRPYTTGIAATLRSMKPGDCIKTPGGHRRRHSWVSGANQLGIRVQTCVIGDDVYIQRLA